MAFFFLTTYTCNARITTAAKEWWYLARYAVSQFRYLRQQEAAQDAAIRKIMTDPYTREQFIDHLEEIRKENKKILEELEAAYPELKAKREQKVM